MYQFIRFACVGVANTLVDLVVLNILTILFQVKTTGPAYIFCKAISFTCAVINSYILNKYWVFKSTNSGSGGGSALKEKTSFIVVSLIGLIVNVAISSLALSVGTGLLPQISHQLLINAAAIVGTGAVLVSNFFGYKYFVFREVKSEVKRS